MKKFAALLLAGVIMAGCAAGYAAGGTAGDPLISLSYLTGVFLPSLVQQAEDRADAAAQRAYQAAYSTLPALPAAGQGPAVPDAAPDSSGFADQRFKRGDVLTLPTGSGILLLAGSAIVTYSEGAVVDVTAGQTAASGTALTPRHRYLAAEQTAAAVSISSDTAVISLEGPYSCAPSQEVDYNALADALRAMGMFRGGDLGYGAGYELERAPTRIEGLIMFLRLLGEEQDALVYMGPCPFADVPNWCRNYVAYAYAQGYTNGIGTDAAGQQLFGLENTITSGEYATFVLRALGYRDSGAAPDFSWDTALEAGLDTGLLTGREYQLLRDAPFLRAQVAYLSYFSLSARMRDGSGTLLDALTARGGVDRAAVWAVMAGVDVQRLY